jgi:hypothetical protein
MQVPETVIVQRQHAVLVTHGSNMQSELSHFCLWVSIYCSWPRIHGEFCWFWIASGLGATRAYGTWPLLRSCLFAFIEFIFLRSFPSPGVKRLGREADHSPPTTADVEKTWICTSTPPYAFMARCLLKNKKNPLPVCCCLGCEAVQSGS